MPTEGLDTTPVHEDIPVVGVTTRSGAVLDPLRPENKEQEPISMAALAKEQLYDSRCQEIRKDLDITDRTRFYENGDGMLCRHGQQEGTQQVVLPRSLVAYVLNREHSSPLGGHPGETKMYWTIRRRYYWPSLAADVLGWVAACATCAKKRLMEVRSCSAMRLFMATEAFEAVAIDLLGPLPRAPEGYEYLLVMCDRFSKLTRVVPLRHVTALDVLSAFIDVWIASYGISDSTLSDNGPQLASVHYQGVLQMLGVSTHYATPYHPQTNGQVERFNKTLVLLASKKWRLHREGRQSRRQGVEMMSDWLFVKPRSNYWLRAAASNLASQSPCLARVTQSFCNPQ